MREIFKLKPGKEFKKLLDEIEREQLANPEIDREGLLEKVKEILGNN